MSLPIHRWEKPGEPAEKVRLEKELKAQGYRTEFWVDKPGVSYRNRKHDVDTLIWVLRGEGKITIGPETDILRDGDRIVLPAQTLYSLESLGAKALLWLFGMKKKK
jgi:mannose-6-phosphate isomerase-like protein (cupin superfamily)